jgi:hypothetical protein
MHDDGNIGMNCKVLKNDFIPDLCWGLFRFDKPTFYDIVNRIFGEDPDTLKNVSETTVAQWLFSTYKGLLPEPRCIRLAWCFLADRKPKEIK